MKTVAFRLKIYCQIVQYVLKMLFFPFWLGLVAIAIPVAISLTVTILGTITIAGSQLSGLRRHGIRIRRCLLHGR